MLNSLISRLLPKRAFPNFVSVEDTVEPRKVKEGADPQLPFDRFSDFLPYLGYDEETQLFAIEGAKPGDIEGLAFVLELTPQVGASREMADFLTNLFTIDAPPSTGLQVQIFGSPKLDNTLDLMQAITTGGKGEEDSERTRLLQMLAKKRADFYARGAVSDLYPGFNYRMREYRANLSVVVPFKDPLTESARRQMLGLRQNIINTLNQYFLYAYTWTAHDLVNFLALILNPQHTLGGRYPSLNYDAGRLLKYQIIAPDTAAEEEKDHIVYRSPGVQDIAIRAMSVRSYPRKFGLHHMGGLLGSASSTSVAYPCPFLITMGVGFTNYEKEKNKTLLKAARSQQKVESGIGRFLPGLDEINADWKMMQRAFDGGKGNVKMCHQLLLFAPPDQMDRCEQAARGVWRSEQFEITVDTLMQKQGLLASLPMLHGSLLQADLRIAQRFSTKTVYNAANMLPLIGEWQGTPPRDTEPFQRPVLTPFGRRGQIIPIDIFANPSGNYNGVIVGKPGSGKSFLLNELIKRALGTGSQAFVIDKGFSYYRQCILLGGQFIDFAASSNICLNPFAMLGAADDEDRMTNKVMLLQILEQMISPSRPLTDYERAHLSIHVDSVLIDAQLAGMKAATIDMLAESLINNCEKGGPNPRADEEWRQMVASMSHDDRSKVCDPAIRALGVQLAPYREDGRYGHFFKGDTAIEFRSNFIVLELDSLGSATDLQAVVMMILMLQITNQMFLGGRDKPRIVVIDEAWDVMSEGNSGKFVEAGYRKARKYFGAFWTATQGVNDYFKSATATAAFECADWTCLLSQKPESIAALAKSQRLVLDDETKALLASVKTVQGRFSEVFIRGGDMPPTVCRLFVDPFSQLLYSSKAPDFTAIQKYQDSGLSVVDAIEAVMRDRQMDC
jgi:conjugal transfer ATP-binding protein TraC